MLNESETSNRAWQELDSKAKEKGRKKVRNARKMERIMKGKRVKIYAVSGKINTVRDIAYNRDLDFIMISEAGLGKRKEPELRGYTAFRADHVNKSRGSVMYVRDGYIPTTLRINEKEENTVSSEFIQDLLQRLH